MTDLYKKASFFPLDGEAASYPAWARATMGLFANNKLDLTNDGDSPAIFSILNMSLASGCNSFLAGQVDLNNGIDLWKLIKDTYASDNPANIHDLASRLNDLQPDAFTSLPDYLNELNRILDLLKSTQTKDYSAILRQGRINVLRRLPDKLTAIATDAINKPPIADGDLDKEWRELDRRIRNFCSTIGDPLAIDKQQRALAAQSHPNPTFDTSAYGAFDRSDWRGRGGAGRGRGRGRGGGGGGSGRRPYRGGPCYTCGDPSHPFRECPNGSKHGGTFSGPGRGRGRGGGRGGSSGRGGGFRQPKFQFLTSAALLAAQPPARDGELLWCVDSGATDHVCSVKTILDQYRDSPHKIGLAGGQTIISPGYGHACNIYALAFDGTRLDLELLNTRYMDDGANLLSLHCLRKAGHGVHFDDNPRIAFRDGPSLPLEVSGGLFWLRTHLTSPEVPGVPSTALLSVSTADSDSLKRLLRLPPLARHARLGHLNAGDMARIGALRARETLPFCDICPLGKSTRTGISSRAAERTLAPGRLTHVDFNGPMQTPDFFGNRYSLLFIDDTTRFQTIYFVTSKTEANKCLEMYCDSMAGHGYRIHDGAAIQTDNDSVFLHGLFNSYCKRTGIRLQLSAPHTQGQNGVVERAQRTILDTARTMLLASGLDKRYWSMAMSHACYLRNCLPTSAKDHQRPFELLLQRTPPLDALRIFGSPAYVFIERTSRGKWDPKALRGVYVGRSNSHKADKIFIESTKRMRISAHVTYHEPVLLVWW